jgi:hypothetical protein
MQSEVDILNCLDCFVPRNDDSFRTFNCENRTIKRHCERSEAISSEQFYAIALSNKST